VGSRSRDTNTLLARWDRREDRPGLIELPRICRKPGEAEPLEAPRAVPSSVHVLDHPSWGAPLRPGQLAFIGRRRSSSTRYGPVQPSRLRSSARRPQSPDDPRPKPSGSFSAREIAGSSSASSSSRPERDRRADSELVITRRSRRSSRTARSWRRSARAGHPPDRVPRRAGGGGHRYGWAFPRPARTGRRLRGGTLHVALVRIEVEDVHAGNRSTGQGRS